MPKYWREVKACEKNAFGVNGSTCDGGDVGNYGK
jgi:hypothetical protein